MTVFIWQIDNLTSFLEFSCSRKLVNSTHLPRSPKFANISYLNERKLMYTPDVNDNDGLYLSFKNWNVKTHDHTYKEKVKLKAGSTPGSTKLSICFWTLRVRRDGALLKTFHCKHRGSGKDVNHHLGMFLLRENPQDKFIISCHKTLAQIHFFGSQTCWMYLNLNTVFCRLSIRPGCLVLTKMYLSPLT